uniref:Large ribosomal subunit protein uL13c n=1 Tax=Polysiphonia urceolata TaxID=173545 RepID=A0A1Z1MCS4_POLUR|nr:ribosomal protein L13 [Polysiphonia stricta]ARW63581.1 ribosomal protein L13 [Polysiphonia stricta]
MNTHKNKTIIKKPNKTTDWYIVDATKYRLGRLSSHVAHVLKNKHNINYLPYQEGNTKVIIINSQNIQVTGRKNIQKTYKRHSGRPGGLKVETFNKLQQRIPNRILEHAIKGMLPKNALGRKLFKNVKVYSNNTHPYQDKQLIELNIT